MPTPVSPRRFAALRACAALLASGLVLGLAVTPVAAAPAEAGPTSSDVSEATSTAVEPLAPTFVQEGMPTRHGGQLVTSEDTGISEWFPKAQPVGTNVVATSAGGGSFLVLRDDGRVDWYEDMDTSGGDKHLLTPLNGTTYIGVSAGAGGGRLLRSDGVVVSPGGVVVMSPPAGQRFTAIAGSLALRSDGVVEPAGGTCAAERTPDAGISYTALAVGGAWAALRSDGRILYCRSLDGVYEARLIEPPSGTVFVGMDLNGEYMTAATADGRVVDERGAKLAAAPSGRSIISLSNTSSGASAGAAVLDDGSLIRWGYGSEEPFEPVIPEGRDVYSGVNGSWVIMVGDPIPVEVSAVPQLQEGRVPRVTESVRFKVSAALSDGRTVPGWVDATAIAPDGHVTKLESADTRHAPADVMFWSRDHTVLGGYGVTAVFSGTPYAQSAATALVEFREPSPVTITAVGPTMWHDGTERTQCVTITPRDPDSSLWWSHYGQAIFTVEGTATARIEFGNSSEVNRFCLWELDLKPGTYTVHLDYEGWGEVDSASWSGEIEVLPPAVTHIESDLPTSWRYGEMPDVVWATVTSEGVADPWGHSGVGLEFADGTPFGFGGYLNDDGRARLWIGGEDELLPGTYEIAAEFDGREGFLPSRQEKAVTVTRGVFSTATPTISGTAKVGKTLTVSRNSWSPEPTSEKYVWKANGEKIATRTSKTFVVPVSAKGKRLTVTAVGSKTHYTTKYVRSAATAVVAPGTFSAPRPTISRARRVGATLTVTRGSWSPSPSSVKYVWKANGVRIATRTSKTFVIPSSARGKRLTVTVVGSRSGYTTKYVTSYRTSTIS